MRHLISGARVWTGEAGECVTGTGVLVDGETVVAVGAPAELERHAGADVRRHEYPAATIVPGLVNAHVPLAFDAFASDLAESVRATEEGDLPLGMAGRAQQLLSAGVTTARDLGDRGGLLARTRAAIDSGVLAGPRLLMAGPPLTAVGGHCWFLGAKSTARLRSGIGWRATQTSGRT